MDFFLLLALGATGAYVLNHQQQRRRALNENALALLLGSTAKALPEVFAERRAALP